MVFASVGTLASSALHLSLFIKQAFGRYVAASPKRLRRSLLAPQLASTGPPPAGNGAPSACIATWIRGATWSDEPAGSHDLASLRPLPRSNVPRSASGSWPEPHITPHPQDGPRGQPRAVRPDLAANIARWGAVVSHESILLRSGHTARTRNLTGVHLRPPGGFRSQPYADMYGAIVHTALLSLYPDMSHAQQDMAPHLSARSHPTRMVASGKQGLSQTAGAASNLTLNASGHGWSKGVGTQAPGY